MNATHGTERTRAAADEITGVTPRSRPRRALGTTRRRIDGADPFAAARSPSRREHDVLLLPPSPAFEGERTAYRRFRMYGRTLRS
ncbi:Hypothetical protein A7982_04645 [Minicystis rosea]|nr:Hypothetical protein A7982_04645 [Minicystis rosea]